MNCAFGIILKKNLCLTNGHTKKKNPIFSSRNVIILCFIIKYMIHFELIFIYGGSYELKFVISKVDI